MNSDADGYGRRWLRMVLYTIDVLWGFSFLFKLIFQYYHSFCLTVLKFLFSLLYYFSFLEFINSLIFCRNECQCHRQLWNVLYYISNNEQKKKQSVYFIIYCRLFFSEECVLWASLIFNGTVDFECPRNNQCGFVFLNKI